MTDLIEKPLSLTRKQRLAAFYAYCNTGTILRDRLPTDEQLKSFDWIVAAALGRQVQS